MTSKQMPKSGQLNVRISPETRRQLDALKAHFGESEGDIVSRLIDREYQNLKRKGKLVNEKPVVKLDRAEIARHIELGDNCEGGYVLAVAPGGSDHRVHWMAKNRQWDPWPNGWLTISIPALNPDGSGKESEDAEYMLKLILSPTEFAAVKAQVREGDKSWPELAEELRPEDWRVNQREALDWLADAFLYACNGDGGDLNEPAPWGERRGEHGEPLGDNEPPAEFEWA